AMSSDMTSRAAADGPRASRARLAAGRCPVDPGHQMVAVPALYQSGRAQIGIELRHGPGGVPGRSMGRAQAQTPLSAALAPRPVLASWQRPVRVAVVALAALALLVLGAGSSLSEQDLAGLKLLGTVAAVVAAAAGLTARSRRRAHEQLGAAHATAAT